MFDINLEHININEFRRPALEWLKNFKSTGVGFYVDAPKNSYEWVKYWDEQEYYCKNGYSVGGLRITGEHYFYLNFCQIQLKTGFSSEVIKSKRKVDKLVTFPDFWDSDWFYFTECEKAKEEGQHMLILKPRRRGYSYKNAAKCAYNYTFYRSSTSLIIAESSDYSEETMGMAVSYLDFLIKYTDFGKNRLVNKPKEEVLAGFEEILADGSKSRSGYLSRILALTAKNNPSVARGKDANVILFEEAGSFSNLKATYRATRPTVEEGLGVSGQIFVFGTGGDFSGGIVDFEEMFYNPEPYNFRCYSNVWEEGMELNKIGYFLPDYYSKGGFISDKGESLINEAELHIEGEIEKLKRTSKDSSAVDAFLAEFPRRPKEAFIKTSSNIFPKAELQAQINYIKSSKIDSTLGVAGILSDEEGAVTFTPSDNLKPIDSFPIKKDSNREGCFVQYQRPHYENGRIPDNLYYIGHDPYGVDSDRGESLGSLFVLKQANNLSQPDDCIVAEYSARPSAGQDEYNRIMFMIAKYYNAKIGFENDRGNVIQYARSNKVLHLLQDEADIYDKGEKVSNSLGRSFGMSMSNLKKKQQGAIYLRDWLLAKRGIDPSGKHKLNLNMIYSVPLLEELLKFDYEGNFDRVSAMLVAMFYQKQVETKTINRIDYIYEADPFFNRFHSLGNLDSNY
jgi:hypothetical protein